jgi:hypothetical protein
MNVAFQVEIFTNSDGVREIVRVECDPTTDPPSDELNAQEVGAGAWEVQFVLPESFGDRENVFRQFRRYGLAAQTVRDACADAMQAAV